MGFGITQQLGDAVQHADEIKREHADEEYFGSLTTETQREIDLGQMLLRQLRSSSGDDATKLAGQLQTAMASMDAALGVLPPYAKTKEDHEYLAFLKQQARELKSDSEEPIAKAETRTTGIEIVDKGPFCEQEGKAGPGCYLTHDRRQYLVSSLIANSKTACANLRSALENAQLDGFGQAPEVLPMLAEVVFGVVTGAGWGIFAGRLVEGFTELKTSLSAVDAAKAAGESADLIELAEANDRGTLGAAVAKLSSSQITGAVSGALGAARSHVKDAKEPSTADQDKTYVRSLQAGVGPLETHLANEVPARVDDVTLAALAYSFQDDAIYGIPAFADKIADLVSRFNRQHIADAGVGHGEGHRLRVAKLVVGEKSRLAMVRVAPAHESFGGQVETGDNTLYFENFIDDDFSDLAVATDAANSGEAELVIDVSQGRGGLQLRADDMEPDQDANVNLVPSRNLDHWIAKATGDQ